MFPPVFQDFSLGAPLNERAAKNPLSGEKTGFSSSGSGSESRRALQVYLPVVLPQFFFF